jgi:DNA-binding response OmpR family regulator
VGRVLIFDESRLVTPALTHVLEEHGFLVDLMRDGDELVARVVASPPAAVLLVDDSSTRLAAAVETLRVLSNVPIVACVAIVRTCAPLLELGADHCVPLDVSPYLLVAHLRASLRRAYPPPEVADIPPRLVFDDLVLDRPGREVWRGGRRCELTAKEFDLLVYLVGRPGRVVTRRELMVEVWHEPSHLDDHTVDVHLSALRRKLGESGAHPRFLRTVRGAGVKFVVPREPTPAEPLRLPELVSEVVGATQGEAGDH